METELIEGVLMLHGETRHCDDCDTATVFLPVEDISTDHESVWICTSCDGAVVVPDHLAVLSAAA